MAACMPDVASPDEVKVQEQKLSPSASRLGLLVTLISHSAAEERFFAQAKKSDSAAAQRMSKLLLTCPLPGTPSRQSRDTAKAASCGGKSKSFRQRLRRLGESLLLCSCKEEVTKKKAGPVANRSAAPTGPLRFSRRWGTARKLASLRHAGL